MKKLNEQSLVYQVLTDKDPEAFAALYDIYVKQIYRFVYFKVSNQSEAEDITSEVFLKVWQYIQEQKEIRSFRGLLYRIARNCVVDLYRTRSAHPEVHLEVELEVGDSGRWATQMFARDDTAHILRALTRLKQEYREVITLYYIDELKIVEISEIMGKGQIAVRVMLHRALKKLQELIAESAN